MDGDDSIPPHDFFSQPPPSGAAAAPGDGDAWGLTPPRSGGHFSVTGGRGAPRSTGLANLDLNADFAAVASYPNMNMYAHILQPGSSSGNTIPQRRSRSNDVPPPSGRPPRQGLPPVSALDRRGKAVVASTSRAASGKQRQGAPTVADDVGEEDEDDEDDNPMNQHSQDDSSDGDSADKDDLSSDEDSVDQDDLSSDDEEEVARTNRLLALLHLRRQRLNKIGMITNMLGTYYNYRFMDKGERRILKARESGYEWVVRTLGHRTDCYKMFRMYRPVFDKLHNVLAESYGLKSTKKMSSVEALALFLWILGAPQSVRQAENRFVRSMETISRKFDKVLECVVKLAVDIIKPRDAEFRGVHERLRGAEWYPWFNDCIGAIDGTHVQVVVPPSKVPQYLSRHGYCSQNVMAVCDFDMRFTFVLAGWPGSVHDMRVFKDALSRFTNKFPHPPPGKFYLVDSGYPNRSGYLAPYRGQKYHFQEFHQGTMPRGKKEHFNYTHSRLRNVIERSFGVLKNKWRILFKIPSYPLRKQAKIIVACMALHNFIRESHMADKEFDMCDNNENYQPLLEETRRRRRNTRGQEMEPDSLDMNQMRDRIANGLFIRR